MKNERFAFLVRARPGFIPVPEDRFANMPERGLRVRMNPYWDHLVADGALVPGIDPDAPASPVEPEPAAKASKAKP